MTHRDPMDVILALAIMLGLAVCMWGTDRDFRALTGATPPSTLISQAWDR